MCRNGDGEWREPLSHGHTRAQQALIFTRKFFCNALGETLNIELWWHLMSWSEHECKRLTLRAFGHDIDRLKIRKVATKSNTCKLNALQLSKSFWENRWLFSLRSVYFKIEKHLFGTAEHKIWGTKVVSNLSYSLKGGGQQKNKILRINFLGLHGLQAKAE